VGAGSTRWSYVQRLRRYQPRQFSAIGDAWPSVHRMREDGVDAHGPAVKLRPGFLHRDDYAVSKLLRGEVKERPLLRLVNHKHSVLVVALQAIFSGQKVRATTRCGEDGPRVSRLAHRNEGILASSATLRLRFAVSDATARPNRERKP
jgi:hypothetical protein